MKTFIFLVSALKIMIISFKYDLDREWIKIVRTLRNLNKRNEASIFLWDFLEFNATNRTPLYIMLNPFVGQKLNASPISEFEKNMQTKIKDIMLSYHMNRCRHDVLKELMADYKKLKQEIEDRRLGESLIVGIVVSHVMRS